MTEPAEHPGVNPEQEEKRESPPLRQWRVGAVVLALCALFGAVMARTLDLQVDRSEDLTRQAQSQLAGGLQIRARRGAIYDRNGAEMAVSVLAESIFVRPHEVAAPRETAAALASVLGQSEARIIQEISSPQRFRWLARRVAPHIAAQVRDLDLAGVDSMTEWQRFYPMRSRAGQILGFVGDDDFGLEGLERSCDDILAGGMMEVEGLRDAHGRPIIANEIPNIEDLEGFSVVLTIDSAIQRVAEREIERVVLETNARSAIAVVMDPHTGEILAMANWPPFDPNRFRTSHPSDWRNRAVTDSWEPGSTFKTITYAAALEAGVIRPETGIDCAGGALSIGRYRIRDSHRGTGLVPAWQVIQVSSNVGIYRVAQRLGQQAFYDSIRSFGFGEATSAGFAGEQVGLVSSPPWAEIELANRAFGQGISATPIQLTLAYSAIANGGLLMAPQFVREVRNLDGEVIERRQPTVVRRVVREEVARQVTAALESVVEQAGTGTNAGIPGIRVAGKTGTAQKVDPRTGLYGDLWMAAFVGFVPADDPLFTIAVMVDEPQGQHYGGVIAAPVFARIAEYALATRAIFASQEPTPSTVPSDVIETPPIQEIPDPTVQPTELTAVRVGHQPTDRVRIPDFTGLNLQQCLLEAEVAGLAVEVHGWGLVRHQWPAQGGQVPRGAQVDLYLTGQYEQTGDASARSR